MTYLQRHFHYNYTYFYCVVYTVKIPDPWMISVQQLCQVTIFKVEDQKTSNLVRPAKKWSNSDLGCPSWPNMMF